MAADDSDGIILDIERFDLDRNLPLLGVRAKGITKEKIKAATPQDIAQMITQLIDPNAVSSKMRASVAEVGITLAAFILFKKGKWKHKVV